MQRLLSTPSHVSALHSGLQMSVAQIADDPWDRATNKAAIGGIPADITKMEKDVHCEKAEELLDEMTPQPGRLWEHGRSTG